MKPSANRNFGSRDKLSNVEASPRIDLYPQLHSNSGTSIDCMHLF
jgi:hypothetical protein